MSEKTGEFFKRGRACYRLVDVQMWRGATLRVFHVACDSKIQPFAMLSDNGTSRDLEPATAAEWAHFVGLATAHAEAKAEARRRRLEAEEHGIKVPCEVMDGYRRRRDAEPEYIIRATATQWIGVKRRYRRTGNYIGDQLGKHIRPKMITSVGLEILEEAARGRERVDFIAESKAATLANLEGDR